MFKYTSFKVATISYCAAFILGMAVIFGLHNLNNVANDLSIFSWDGLGWLICICIGTGLGTWNYIILRRARKKLASLEEFSEFKKNLKTKQKLVFPARWFECGFHTVGVVMAENSEGKQTAYVGVIAFAFDLDADTKYIVDLGTKLILEDAQCFFPKLDPSKYKYQ